MIAEGNAQNWDGMDADYVMVLIDAFDSVTDTGILADALDTGRGIG